MNAPPNYAIEAARIVAMQSPCAKSKRGVVLFNPETAGLYERNPGFVKGPGPVIVSRGFNGPPPTFACSGSAACREGCAKLCMHAEQRAIMAAGALDDVHDLELVHVKVVGGVVIPGGGPSCWQCSRLVVEVGLRGVWLYETDQTFVGAETIVERDARNTPQWKFYTAEEFHVATALECGLEISR
jgi:deoxycytidylate deaminase